MESPLGLRKLAEAVRTRVGGLFGGTRTSGPAAEVVFVLAVADDMLAAKNMLRLMKLGWERSEGWYHRNGINVVWNVEKGVKDRGLDAFKHPREDEVAANGAPFSEKKLGGEPGSEPAILYGSIDLDFSGSLDDFGLPKTTLVLCLIGPRFFQGEGFGAAKIAELLRDLSSKWHASQKTGNEPDDEHNSSVEKPAVAAADPKPRAPEPPIKALILGITDASLRSDINESIGSGVDQILVPSLLAELSSVPDIAPPKLALAVTGLERDFVRFNPRDSKWSRYHTAQQAASDPEVIRPMLASILLNRPHLQNLLRSELGFREGSDPITVTAVMPCGFMKGWGCANYNARNFSWIVGGPWTAEEKDAPELLPYNCADPVLAALTGRISDLQITSRDVQNLGRIASQLTRFRRYGRAA
jgi:hypothetical protein